MDSQILKAFLHNIDSELLRWVTICDIIYTVLHLTCTYTSTNGQKHQNIFKEISEAILPICKWDSSYLDQAHIDQGLREVINFESRSTY